MLGSVSEAEDAVQEAWLRLSRSDVGDVANLGGWLTTVVARVCLDMLRSRKSLREQPLDAEGHERLPDPILSGIDDAGPEGQAVLADAVGLALLVVLDTLDPPERLAFVLHDMFAMPFEEIAPIVERSPVAARQLASRARRRVRGAAPAPATDFARQREVVEAFLAASRGGDFDALLAVLDPGVVLRADTGTGPITVLRGPRDVLARARMGAGRFAAHSRMVRVNGSPGVVAVAEGRVRSVIAMTVRDGRITELDILTDLERLARLTLPRGD
jgi:RNA polymerase sigma-70 factor (ECF subfamily)